MMRQVALLVVVLSIGLSAQGRDPVAGAWEAVPNANQAGGRGGGISSPPVHLIYANGHYVQFTAAAKRAKLEKQTAEMTREELLERFQMQGQYGTYRVEGNKLIRKSIVAANPNNEGRETTSEFRIEGDTLIVSSQNAQGQKTETRYKSLK